MTAGFYFGSHMEHKVEERVIRVISETCNIEDKSSILDMPIKEIADTSLDQMTLFIALEDEFDQTIPPENIAHITKVDEIISYIEKELKSSTNKGA